MRRWLIVAGFGALALWAFGCSSNNKDNGGTGGVATGTGGAGGGIDLGTGGSGNTGPAACASFVGLNASCGTTTSEASLKKVNTLLVVDKSGSMRDQPAGYTGSKWAALTQALTAVVTDTQKLMAYGLELFPEKSVSVDCTTTCCDMPATGTMDVPAPGDATAITTLLAETLPGGGTPTAQALRSALNYFRGVGASLGGQKVVFLATDGGPNCNADIPGTCPISACTNNIDGKPPACTPALNCCDPANSGQVTGCLDTAEVVTAIQALSNDGIATVVLGLPGTESYATVLEQMAVAGGLPNPAAPPSYYAVNAADGVDGLTNTIKQITTQFINKCEIQLDKAVLDPDKVDVALDCNVLQRPGDGGSGDWRLDSSTTPETVVLQGAVCDRVRTQGAQRIDVILGCPGPAL